MCKTKSIRYLNRITLQVAKTAIELQLKNDEKDKIKDDLANELFLKSLEDLKEQHKFQGLIDVGGEPF